MTFGAVLQFNRKELNSSQVPKTMELMLTYMASNQETVCVDVWNDANMGDVFAYLLNKKKLGP